MKSFTQFLLFLICLEFIIGPVQGSFLISYANAEEKTCPAGQSYDGSVNRCLTKAEVVKVRNAVKSCGSNKDCFKENAQNALNDTSKAKKNDALFKEDGKGRRKDSVYVAGLAPMAIPLIIGANTLLNRWKLQKSSRKSYKCNPNSLLLMYAGAAALGAGEVVGYLVHDKKLKEIKKEWDKNIVPKDESGADKKNADATEAQSQAFEYLAQNEDQVAKTTRLKKGFYLAATGLFAAGTAAAVVEQIQLGKATIESRLPPIDATAIERIRAARATIDKLTCSTDLENRTAKEMNEKNDKALTEKNAIQDESNAEKSRSDKLIQIEKNKVEADDNFKKSRDELENIKCDHGNDVCEQDKIVARKNYNTAKEAKAAADNADAQFKEKARKSKEEKETKPEINPNPCGSGMKFENGNCQPIIEVFRDIWKENQLPEEVVFAKSRLIKKNAAANIAYATNTNQLMEMIHEFESIELEPYSKITYIEGDEHSKAPTITLDSIVAKIISSSLMPEARAEYGLIGKALGVLPVLGSLLNGGGIRFKDDKPIDPGLFAAEKGQVSNKISALIGKPTTRIALNGVFTGWIGFMSIHMGKQAKASEARAETLRLMKEDFISANGILSCTPEQRNDPEKAKCYCYTPDNKVNPARASKAICKMTLAKLGQDRKSAGDKFCVTQEVAVDPSCSCRSSNSCLKSTTGLSKVSFSPATFKMLSSGFAPADKLFNGEVSGADIADSAGINAARIRSSAEELLKKVDPKAAKESSLLASATEKSLLASAGGYSAGGNSSSPLPTSPAAAAAALDKEIKDSKDTAQDSPRSFSPSGNYSNDPAPEFGLGAQEAASQEIEIAEVMGKEVDFGTSDINKAPETNIFEVLSNRYQRSGMKRLLEDGNQTPADAPSNTDISD